MHQPRIQLPELLEPFVERDERLRREVDGDERFVERDGPLAAAASHRVVLTSMVDEDAPHRHGRGRQEVDAIAPLDARDVDEAHVGLVDERCGDECMPVPLVLELAVSDAPELVVDEREDAVERLAVPFAAAFEEQLGEAGLGIPGRRAHEILLRGVENYGGRRVPHHPASGVRCR